MQLANKGGVLAWNADAFNCRCKQILVADFDRFAEAFVKQVVTFALRRVMTTVDRAQITSIVTASKPGGYRLRTVVESLVLSDLFQIC